MKELDSKKDKFIINISPAKFKEKIDNNIQPENNFGFTNYTSHKVQTIHINGNFLTLYFFPIEQDEFEEPDFEDYFQNEEEPEKEEDSEANTLVYISAGNKKLWDKFLERLY